MDTSLSPAERTVAQGMVDDQLEASATLASEMAARPMAAQKRAAELLSVSQATLSGMTKDNLAHPVEIIPGTWRYPFREIITLARNGVEAVSESRKICCQPMVAPEQEKARCPEGCGSIALSYLR